MKFSSFLLLISCSIAAPADAQKVKGGFTTIVGKHPPLEEDDKNFRYTYENKKGKVQDLGGCEFVGKLPTKRCRVRINGKNVADSCPTTCARPNNRKMKEIKKKMMKMKKTSNDKDDKKFMYVYKNKNGEEVVKEDGCEFVAKKKEKRCSQKVKGDKVSDMCPETCEGYDDDHHVEFSLEGTRTYIGCSAEFFEMTIECGVFGDDDPELCLLRAVGVGELMEGEDGLNYIRPFPDYVPNIDDIDPDKVCVASGTFSLDRVTEDMLEPVPLTVSDGCSFQGVTEDYQYVVKGVIDREENTIQLSYSNDFGFTYYTDEIETPETYTAIVAELEEAHDDRRLSHGGSSGYTLPSWYIYWLRSRGYNIPGCLGRPTSPPTASPIEFDSSAPASTRVPRQLKTRDLGDASSKKKQTQSIII